MRSILETSAKAITALGLPDDKETFDKVVSFITKECHPNKLNTFINHAKETLTIATNGQGVKALEMVQEKYNDFNLLDEWCERYEA